MASEVKRSSGRRATLHLKFSRAHLPPVRDALVLGRRARVGERAVVQAMEAISPGVFELVEVDHPVVEAILVRRSELRKVGGQVLADEILRQAGPLMSEQDALHVEVDLEVETSVWLEL